MKRKHDAFCSPLHLPISIPFSIGEPRTIDTSIAPSTGCTSSHVQTDAAQRPPASHGATSRVTPPTVTSITRPGAVSHVSAKCNDTR